MDPNMEMSNHRSFMDTNANTTFCYPHPYSRGTGNSPSSWVLDTIPGEPSSSEPRLLPPSYLSRRSSRLKRSSTGNGPAASELSRWKPSWHSPQGRGFYRLAPAPRQPRRRHAHWNSPTAGYHQQRNPSTTMAMFKVTRQDLKLELKMKGLDSHS